MIVKKLKKFAERDYNGLSKNGAEELRKIRNKIAKDLRAQRKSAIGSKALENIRDAADYNAWDARVNIIGRECTQAAKRKELAEQLRRKKNLKIAGKTALGVGLASGLAVGAKKLYDKNKKSKEFSETKEKVSKGLACGSTATGLGALGATAASLGYGAKSVKRGLENSAAYEGKTLGELLKSKKFKDAATRIKRAFNNR